MIFYCVLYCCLLCICITGPSYLGKDTLGKKIKSVLGKQGTAALNETRLFLTAIKGQCCAVWIFCRVQLSEKLFGLQY